MGPFFSDVLRMFVALSKGGIIHSQVGNTFSAEPYSYQVIVCRIVTNPSKLGSYKEMGERRREW